MEYGKGSNFFSEFELALCCCVVAFLRRYATAPLRRCCYFRRAAILSFLFLSGFGVIALACCRPGLFLPLCVVALLYYRLVSALRCNRCVIALLRFASSRSVVMLLCVRVVVVSGDL